MPANSLKNSSAPTSGGEKPAGNSANRGDLGGDAAGDGTFGDSSAGDDALKGEPPAGAGAVNGVKASK